MQNGRVVDDDSARHVEQVPVADSVGSARSRLEVQIGIAGRRHVHARVVRENSAHQVVVRSAQWLEAHTEHLVQRTVVQAVQRFARCPPSDVENLDLAHVDRDGRHQVELVHVDSVLAGVRRRSGNHRAVTRLSHVVSRRGLVRIRGTADGRLHRGIHRQRRTDSRRRIVLARPTERPADGGGSLVAGEAFDLVHIGVDRRPGGVRSVGVGHVGHQGGLRQRRVPLQQGSTRQPGRARHGQVDRGNRRKARTSSRATSAKAPRCLARLCLSLLWRGGLRLPRQGLPRLVLPQQSVLLLDGRRLDPRVRWDGRRGPLGRRPRRAGEVLRPTVGPAHVRRIRHR